MGSHPYSSRLDRTLWPPRAEDSRLPQKEPERTAFAEIGVIAVTAWTSVAQFHGFCTSELLGVSLSRLRLQRKDLIEHLIPTQRHLWKALTVHVDGRFPMSGA